MNISVNRSVVRAAMAASLLVGTPLIACSSSTEDPGNPSVPGGGSAGTTATAGTSGAAGSTAGTVAGGTGGTTGGGGGTAGAGGGCIGNQMKDPTTGVCACRPFEPTFCATESKCFKTAEDPEHCGNCETKCGATSACVAGACAPEPTSIGEVAGCGTLYLQQQMGKLYLLSATTGTLKTMAIPAGGATTDVATGLTMASAFALDATNAYVVTGTSIQRVTLAGGAKAPVVTETTPIFDVALLGTKLFYAVGTDIKSVDAAANAGAGVSVAKGIDAGLPQAVTAVGDRVLYASSGAFNVESDLIAGEGHIKVGASQGGLIFGHRSLQADATQVYWAVDGTVRRAPFAMPEPVTMTVASSRNAKITAYAFNATHTYFASFDSSETKMKADLEKHAFTDDAEKSTWVARGLPNVTSIVIDDTSLYAATADCKVLKTPL